MGSVVLVILPDAVGVDGVGSKRSRSELHELSPAGGLEVLGQFMEVALEWTVVERRQGLCHDTVHWTILLPVERSRGRWSSLGLGVVPVLGQTHLSYTIP